jgi:hypothetical protein
MSPPNNSMDGPTPGAPGDPPAVLRGKPSCHRSQGRGIGNPCLSVSSTETDEEGRSAGPTTQCSPGRSAPQKLAAVEAGAGPDRHLGHRSRTAGSACAALLLGRMDTRKTCSSHSSDSFRNNLPSRVFAWPPRLPGRRACRACTLFARGGCRWRSTPRTGATLNSSLVPTITRYRQAADTLQAHDPLRLRSLSTAAFGSTT